MSTEISTDSAALHIPLYYNYNTSINLYVVNEYLDSLGRPASEYHLDSLGRPASEYIDSLGRPASEHLEILGRPLLEYLDSLGRPASEYNYGYTYIGEYESKFTESDAQGDPVPM